MRTAALAALVALSSCSGPTQVADAARSERIVAVGDLHGDLDNALQVLRRAGILDDEGHWAAGKTILVQTGDVTDRGADSRALLDLMMRLEVEAKIAGGTSIFLVGNHESMNMMGDWRYVTPEDVQAFGGVGPRKTAFSPAGRYGAWLAARPVVANVDGIVFAHGGITPDFAALGIDGMNERYRSAIAAQDRGAPILGAQGPMWDRSLATAPESEACVRLQDSLTALNARQMVVGHTTQRSGHITPRCGGALHLIDIGIADHYGANLGFWTSQANDATAHYANQTVDLPDPLPPGSQNK